VREFDGDLDDYRDWLLRKEPVAKPRPERKVPVRAKPLNRKPIEARIKRLEELLNRLSAQKADLERRLADPTLYQDPEALKALLADQAYVVREIEQVEAEWLEKHAMLDAEEEAP
jgi:ATP-binding cassette subfamily F protein 3